MYDFGGENRKTFYILNSVHFVLCVQSVQCVPGYKKQVYLWSVVPVAAGKMGWAGKVKVVFVGGGDVLRFLGIIAMVV